MDKEKTVPVTLTYTYQLLVSAGRYAYTRNNHLEPQCFYWQVKDIIPGMLKVDVNFALHTLKQIVEECIDRELFGFECEDEFHNKTKTLDFIKWGLSYIKENGDTNWKPYNENLLRRYIG